MFLRDVPILRTLSDEDRAKIAETADYATFQTGHLIIKEGEVGTDFFILDEGRASALKDGAVVREYLTTDYFGELALLRDHPRAADVRADTVCKCFVLDRATFRRLLGPLDEILEARAAEYAGHASATWSLTPTCAMVPASSTYAPPPSATTAEDGRDISDRWQLEPLASTQDDEFREFQKIRDAQSAQVEEFHEFREKARGQLEQLTAVVAALASRIEKLEQAPPLRSSGPSVVAGRVGAPTTWTPGPAGQSAGAIVMADERPERPRNLLPATLEQAPSSAPSQGLPAAVGRAGQPTTWTRHLAAASWSARPTGPSLGMMAIPMAGSAKLAVRPAGAIDQADDLLRCGGDRPEEDEDQAPLDMLSSQGPEQLPGVGKAPLPAVPLPPPGQSAEAEPPLPAGRLFESPTAAEGSVYGEDTDDDDDAPYRS